ncbi:MAG: YdjY domain-containing protein [Planctomycetota bacterium]|nr:YdjY domain-containing protein [Planctomycetota bacterium]
MPAACVRGKAKEVRLSGTVCLQKGPLELFVCTQGSREYESVIVVKAKPSHVTFALALLGLAPGRPGMRTEGGAFSPPAGAVLDIVARYSVERTENGAKKGEVREVPAWKLLKVAGAGESLDRPIEWVYVGRPEPEALRAADREGTVVCLSNFLEAVIDVPFESTNINADLLYEADFKNVPPQGTPVELIIRPTGRRIEPKKVEIEVVLKKGKPPILDGKPLEMEEFKNAVNAQPADVRAAVLRADADEAFGRVMEIHKILRDGLMNTQMVVLQPTAAAPAPKPPAPPLEVQLTAEDKVRLGDKTLTVEEFRAKAGELLKGVERVHLTVEAKTSPKDVAEVMSTARDHGATVAISRNAPM